MIDKKTIIGLVLIFCVFGVWMYITQPSEEERAKMKQKQDSAIAAQIKAEKEAEKAEQMSEQANDNVSEELIAMAKGDDFWHLRHKNSSPTNSESSPRLQ